jgi:hypothetical protein
MPFVNLPESPCCPYSSKGETLVVKNVKQCGVSAHDEVQGFDVNTHDF